MITLINLTRRLKAPIFYGQSQVVIIYCALGIPIYWLRLLAHRKIQSKMAVEVQAGIKQENPIIPINGFLRC